MLLQATPNHWTVTFPRTTTDRAFRFPLSLEFLSAHVLVYALPLSYCGFLIRAVCDSVLCRRIRYIPLASSRRRATSIPSWNQSSHPPRDQNQSFSLGVLLEPTSSSRSRSPNCSRPTAIRHDRSQSWRGFTGYNECNAVLHNPSSLQVEKLNRPTCYTSSYYFNFAASIPYKQTEYLWVETMHESNH